MIKAAQRIADPKYCSGRPCILNVRAGSEVAIPGLDSGIPAGMTARRCQKR